MNKYSIEEVRIEAERMILDLMEEELLTGTMSADQARQIAQSCLEMLPGAQSPKASHIKDKEDLLVKLKQIAVIHKAVLQVYGFFAIRDLKIENTPTRLYEEINLTKNVILANI